jgi:5-formyltetrahydrofolate cyclo-ligase
VSPLIHQALKDGKLVAIPSFLGSAQAYGARQISHPELDFVQGPFGTREPAQNQPEVLLKQLDLALVPGLGFDARGRRLGRGKGFYDRILAQVAGLKWGVAWDEQIVDEVPVESHDVILDCVVTPTRWLCRSRV